MNTVLFIGCDVHSKTISFCAYQPETNKYSHELKIANDLDLIWKYAKNLEQESAPGTKLVFGYEAGCLGYTLARDIQALGYQCVIMAPTTIRIAQADRVRKTDRRDARSLAQALANKAYNPVYIPDEQDESVRNYIRMREDHQDKVKETKQQINAFVLKLGYKWEKSKWTLAHRKWLKELNLSDLDREILDEYLTTLIELEAKVARFDQKIEEMSHQEKYRELSDSLSCFKGITRPIAMRLITEIGDFSRFQTAGEFASYLGLTPGEYSSGESQIKGAITKMGNSHCRKTLTEAAQSAVRGVPGRKSKELNRRQTGNSPKVIHYADKGNARFQTKFRRMIFEGKNRNTAITACAREMACFIWGMATRRIEDRPYPDQNRQNYDPQTGEVYE